MAGLTHKGDLTQEAALSVKREVCGERERTAVSYRSQAGCPSRALQRDRNEMRSPWFAIFLTDFPVESLCFAKVPLSDKTQGFSSCPSKLQAMEVKTRHYYY